MKVNEYDFNLPEELIAQTPLKDRSASKLLVLDKKTGVVEHDSFKNITNYLQEGDVLVLNDTKVMPARLFGEKTDTHANIELLLLKEMNDSVWECMVKPAKRVKVGTIVSFGNGILKAKCVSILDEGLRHFEMVYEGIFYEVLDQLGEMPLPPYIHEKLENQDRYQTVYSKNVGSAAAPTAGLHFTKNLLETIEKKGVIITYVTLHVGLGTFRPMKVENINDHKMHSEYYEITEQTADILNKAISSNQRIFSVGTTSTRTLESAVNDDGFFSKKSGWTDIFIYPGYKFKVIDSLITNFHLPKSTLVMLVSALAGKENVLNAYQIAIQEKYRFFSFGDSMLIK